MFLLFFQNNLIGFLDFKNEEWIYTYSAYYKSNQPIPPMFDFKCINKTYKSKELFPFFKQRIPSFKQPSISIDINNNSNNSDYLLLKKYGQNCITNNFILKFYDL